MNLSELIKEHPTMNFTVTGNDLLQFGNEIASLAAQRALSDNQVKLFTRNQVIDQFNVCSATLWRWDKLGLIKGKKVGHRKYYAESDIKQLLDSK